MKGVSADKNTILVARGKEKPLLLTVARDALLIGIKTLKELKVGAHVALHMKVEDGKMIVGDLRVR